MDDDAFEKKYNTLGLDIIKTHQMFCQEVLKLLPGQMAVVSNGRVRKKLSHLGLFVGIFYFPRTSGSGYRKRTILVSHLLSLLLGNYMTVCLVFYFVLLLICLLAPFH